MQVFSDKKYADVSKKSARESIVLLKNDGLLPIKNNPKKIIKKSQNYDTYPLTNKCSSCIITVLYHGQASTIEKERYL